MNKYKVIGDLAPQTVEADGFTITGSPRVLTFRRKAPAGEKPETIEVVAVFQCWHAFFKVDEKPQ